MAKITTTWGKSRYAHGSISVKQIVTREQLFDAGRWLAVKLIRRTQDGYDEDGRRFKKYSARYAQWKNVSPSAVDLTLSGDMLNDFDVIWASRTRVRVGFRSSKMAQRALYNEDLGRRFLGIPDAWLRELKRRLADGIDFSRL